MLPRPTFSVARPAPQDAADTTLRGKALIRRMLQFKEASALLECLPGPGQSVHCIMTGRWDFALLLVAIIDQRPAVSLHVGTLAYNRRNVLELVKLLEGKKLDRLILLASAFYEKHNKDVAQWTRETLKAFPGSSVAFARSHAKIIAIEFKDGGTLALDGSPNLRANGNAEQLAVINDPELARFYSAYIDTAIAKATGR